MNNGIDVNRSQKIGLTGEENYIVARGNVGYLRIVGGSPCWSVMTATVGEDHGQIRACPNQLRLRDAAKRLGTELNTNPYARLDRGKREYVVICGLSDAAPGAIKDRTLEALCKRFFEIYDLEAGRDEMRDLYRALTDGRDDEKVYLSDGVWLSSDGSMHDRARPCA